MVHPAALDGACWCNVAGGKGERCVGDGLNERALLRAGLLILKRIKLFKFIWGNEAGSRQVAALKASVTTYNFLLSSDVGGANCTGLPPVWSRTPLYASS